jgi:enoyl-CoA hydratase/carnithine racemase
VTIAALPGWGGTQRLPRLIGPGRAKRMILTGQPIDAAQAEAWGLVSESVAGDDLLARARELAAQIAANAPLAVQATKRLIDAALPVTPAATLETQAGALCGSTKDAQEGRASFLERRPPRYQGR